MGVIQMFNRKNGRPAKGETRSMSKKVIAVRVEPDTDYFLDYLAAELPFTKGQLLDLVILQAYELHRRGLEPFAFLVDSQIPLPTPNESAPRRPGPVERPMRLLGR